MGKIAHDYPVNGSSALSVKEYAPAQTHIISFPHTEKRPLHADPNQDLTALDEQPTLRELLSERIWSGEMMHALRYGTCAGKASGRMTSVQAAGAALGFFVFFMGTLLFV